MTEKLSPRDRVLLAINHQETDRIPVDFLCTDEYWEILGYFLGLESREEIYQYLGVDLRHPRTNYIGPPYKKTQKGGYFDYWGIEWTPQVYQGGRYFEPTGSLLRGINDASELKNYRWPDPEWFDLKDLAGQIECWDSECMYAIALDEFGDPGGPFEIAGYLLGYETLLTHMALKPELVYELLRHISDFFIARIEKVLTTLSGRIDLIWTSDDIAHQHGMLLSISMWDEIIRPHHERINRRVHELGSKVMYHSCGSVLPAIPGLIEAGIDVLDVLQWSAKGMVPEVIKNRFGNVLSFHGGLDVQSALPRLSPEELRHEVRHIITVMSRDGGYILSPSHNVQVDTPPTNLVIAYEEAKSIEV